MNGASIRNGLGGCGKNSESRSNVLSGPARLGLAWLSLRGFVERERGSVGRGNEASKKKEEECGVVDGIRLVEEKERESE